jgi:phosphoglycolate phosphatase-like HAD superfamily hydrolase
LTGVHNCAVIFDVDGPLLHLRKPEEDAFFAPLEKVFGITGLSRDWDSYRVRNDRDIIHEVLGEHLGDRFEPSHYDAFVEAYDAELKDGFASGRLEVSIVPKARDIVGALAETPGLALGIATANLKCAAEIRLRQAGLWDKLSAYPGTADRSGHKHEVLARVISDLALPSNRIVFIGDNLNDLEAGRKNGTHFIGFHVHPDRRRRLTDNGAEHVSGDHTETLALISRMLTLTP